MHEADAVCGPSGIARSHALVSRASVARPGTQSDTTERNQNHVALRDSCAGSRVSFRSRQALAALARDKRPMLAALALQREAMEPRINRRDAFWRNELPVGGAHHEGSSIRRRRSGRRHLPDRRRGVAAPAEADETAVGIIEIVEPVE